MELLVFGHAGIPLIVFPTSMGRFYDYEDLGMIRAVDWRYEAGALQAFTLDGVDAKSWYNKHAHPRERVRRHNQYEQCVINEAIPYIRSKNPSQELGLTGCSFGGYHVMNFALRHPDMVTYAVSTSGAFDIRQFLDGYFDDNCYFNAPLEFLPNLNDDWYLSRYPHSHPARTGHRRARHLSGRESAPQPHHDREAGSTLARRLGRRHRS